MSVSLHDVQSQQHDKIPWRANPSKRTQAMPKRSLFGTALEHVDRESLKDIEGKYIPEGFIKQPPNRYPLPDHIKASIPGKNSLETSRREIAVRHDLLSEADEILKNKAEKVFSFKEMPDQRLSHSSHSKRSGNRGWLTERDLEHSEDINIVGLNPRGNYNHDKYRKKPQTHNYSLIGDILAPNMDFNSFHDERQDGFISETEKKNIILGPRRHLPNNSKNGQNISGQKILPKSLIDLPPNIRHTFGSRVCDNLLCDQSLVSLALERQRQKSGPPRPSKKETVEAAPIDMSDTYTSLGHTTRYNICPGISSGQKISRTQAEFNDEVHLRRVPNPDEFRYQRDELSTWSEHNVLRERMKKAWDDAYPLGIWVEQDVLRRRMQKKWSVYFDALPKATANWDRNAKRSVVMVPKPSKPKPQPKPKNKQLPKPKSQPSPEDDIIFVTPPLTPPPIQDERIELPKEFVKDEEFWSFYDQPAP